MMPSRNRYSHALVTLFAFTTFMVVLVSCVGAEELDPYSKFRLNTYETQNSYLKRVTEHQFAVMADLESKLQQQKWQTNAIAVMVYILVLSGIFLSGLQFYKDYKSNTQSPISLKIGSSSLELNSTVIGVAILAMSFMFFQSYIDRVYEVRIVQIPIIDVTTFGLNQ